MATNKLTINVSEFDKKCREIDGRKLNADRVADLLFECTVPADKIRETGSWKLYSAIYKCSVCGGNFEFVDGDPSSYCPFCGAEMENKDAD